MAKKLPNEKEESLWKDRKRVLGFIGTFTRYELFEDRLIVRTGLFRTVTDEIMLYRIMDIRLSRKLGQKMFGLGTVMLMGSDKTHPTMELRNIRRSDKVRRYLSQLIDRERIARGVTSREFFTSGDGDLLD